MKISDWLSVIIMITFVVCSSLYMRTLHLHQLRMDVLSCRIDLVNARIDTLRGKPAGDTTCTDELRKKSNAAGLRSYDLYVPATKPL